LKNRDTTVICWEILRAMAPGQQNPTRLARVANVPYDRLPEYLGLLTARGLAKVEQSEGHVIYSITPQGMEVLHHLDSGLKMLFSALE
jgi:predicted transcriptional regulator